MFSCDEAVNRVQSLELMQLLIGTCAFLAHETEETQDIKNTLAVLRTHLKIKARQGTDSNQRSDQIGLDVAVRCYNLVMHLALIFEERGSKDVGNALELVAWEIDYQTGTRDPYETIASWKRFMVKPCQSKESNAMPLKIAEDSQYLQ